MIREFLAKGTARIKFFRWGILVILGYYVIVLAWMIIRSQFQMYIDFPCFAEVSGQGCLSTYALEEVAESQIEVYLTIYYADAHGGGCLSRASATEEVVLQGHQFRRDGENLLIDQQITLGKNETWEDGNIVVFWNPWRLTRESIFVENQGIVTCVVDYGSGERIDYGPTLVAIGHSGTHYTPNYVGTAIGAVLLGLLVYNFLYCRRSREPLS